MGLPAARQGHRSAQGGAFVLTCSRAAKTSNPLGTACSSKSDCGSAFCTDACAGIPRAPKPASVYNQPVAMGVCAALTSGKDPNAAVPCGGSSSCFLPPTSSTVPACKPVDGIACVHRSLTEPVLIAGLPRTFAFVLWRFAIVVIVGLGQNLVRASPIVLHVLFAYLTKREPHFVDIGKRGPDLALSTPAELVSAIARLNTAIRGFDSSWSVFVEAQRLASMDYPHSSWPDVASWMIDLERRAAVQQAGARFESTYYLIRGRQGPLSSGAGLATARSSQTQHAGRSPERGRKSVSRPEVVG